MNQDSASLPFLLLYRDGRRGEVCYYHCERFLSETWGLPGIGIVASKNMRTGAWYCPNGLGDAMLELLLATAVAL